MKSTAETEWALVNLMEGMSEVYPLGTLETDEPGLTSRTRPKPEENLLGVQSESSKIGTIEMREREGPDKHCKKKKEPF